MKCNTNCSALQPIVHADPDIAGLGVLISFIVVAWLTVITCLIWWYIGLVEHAAHRTFYFPIIDKWFGDYLRSQSDTWLGADQRLVCRNVLRALVLAFSDQQLITGIALLATGQLKFCQITVYHYHTVILLAVVSGVVHSLTMQVLREFMLQQPLLIIFRVCGMMTHFTLLFISVFQSRGILLYPVSCSFIFSQNSTVTTPEIIDGLLIDTSSSTSSRLLAYFSMMLNLYNFIFLITSWRYKIGYRLNMFQREFFIIPDRLAPTPYHIIKSFIFSLLLAFSVLISVNIFVFRLREQVNPYLDGSEDEWGFGQIMPNILLLISLFAALEAICDEIDSKGKWYSWLLWLPQKETAQRNMEGEEESSAHNGEQIQAQIPLRNADQERARPQTAASLPERAEFRPRRNDTESRYDLAENDTRSLLVHNGRDISTASSSRQPQDRNHEDLVLEESPRVNASLGVTEADINNGASGEIWDGGDLDNMPLASPASTALPEATPPSRLAASASATVEASSSSSAINVQDTNEPPSRRTTFERDSVGTNAIT